MATAAKAYGGIAVDIRGIPEVQAMLSKIEQPKVNVMLQRVTAAGGKALKPFIVSAAPGPAQPGNPRQHPGDLKRSIWVHRAKRNRPATVVGHHRKVAFYAGMVIAGTKPHRIRFHDQVERGVGKKEGNIKHPGSHPDPFIERGLAAGRAAAVAAMQTAVAKELAKL